MKNYSHDPARIRTAVLFQVAKLRREEKDEASIYKDLRRYCELHQHYSPQEGDFATWLRSIGLNFSGGGSGEIAAESIAQDLHDNDLPATESTLKLPPPLWAKPTEGMSAEVEFRVIEEDRGSEDLRELIERSGESFIKPVDPDLAARIAQEEREIIDAMEGAKKEDIRSAVQAMKRAAIKGYLMKHGKLVHSDANRFYFLNKKESKLYDLEQPLWPAWLYCLCYKIIDPDTQEEITKELVIASRLLPSTPVYRFSFWDSEKKVLYISRFDGTVYRLDGSTRETIPNGEEVLFDDPVDWVPYNPAVVDLRGNDVFTDLIHDFPRWDGHDDAQSLGFYVWVLSLFFSELCSARPIALFLGEKGSGKSTLLRLLLKYLFGKNAEVSGVPDRPDAFTVLAATSHIIALDNMDVDKPWLQDKLSRLSTGGTETLRKLFTTAEAQVIRYRSFVAITARTPDTLKRDDVAERTVTFNLRRINEGAEDSAAFMIEREMFRNVEEHRGQFWEALLTRLSAVVRTIREDQFPKASMLRLADWETLGRLLSRMEDKEAIWDTTLECFGQNQRRLLIEDEPLLDALRVAIRKEKIRPDTQNEYTANGLYQLLMKMYEEDKQKPADAAFESVRSFSKKLAMLSPMLKEELGLQRRRGTTKADLNRWLYSFPIQAFFEACRAQNQTVEERRRAG